ncbi:MAG: MFS transporter [Acidobacteria bacterium]|nr:MFS transporter [Acidobacteriota bacterium]
MVPRAMLTGLFSPFRYRNFRLLWLGLVVSFTGSFMQQASILWHVSLVAPPGHKGLALGMVGLVRAAPMVLFSMLAGVAADAFDRRRLMLITQIGGAAVAGLLATLAFAGASSLWPVYLLAALGAAVGTFDPPARHALVASLVSREHLPQAVNLNSAMVQATSVAGPALGGLIIAQANVGWAFVVNAVSFLFVVAALLLMRDLPRSDRSAAQAREQFLLHAAREGLHWVFRHPVIRSTMLLDFFATFFASAMALLPVFAQDVLHVGARGYGVLAAAPAAGALAATVVLLPLSHRLREHGRVLLAAILGYGVATIVFGLSTSFAVTFLCLALTGASDAVSAIIRNLIRQLETPDAIRGRMLGINMMFFQGGPQLGELEAGLVAQALGPRFSAISGGLGCLAATLLIALMTPQLRRYQLRFARHRLRA